ncbi:hypothetical protein CPJCM30710_32720 [Clostridium polyendosporum]|uniref:Prolow-density lipoprotein receptor-related protein 1-like beta-propeller domain-containing protein n=1 Tax=Clostridium polyendosporum TaxID=69208 RepID=A0A919S2A4_9CLOT|nr:DUF5050 domain-containing protein [Clostridium polyendosporum]GIM30606.1 hypothetical protein CPJCM30710_32720 [Clostridium polyendosporum]
MKTKSIIISSIILVIVLSGILMYGYIQKKKEPSKDIKQDKILTQNESNKTNIKDGIKAGLVTQQGDWIYYLDYKYSLGGELHRVRKNGEGDIKVIDDIMESAKIVDDWIYYISDFEHGYKLYKVKIDGTEKTLLVDTGLAEKENIPANYVGLIDIVDNTIYYRYITDWSIKASKIELYKMKTDGREKIKIADNMFGFHIKDGWIYYKNFDDEKMYKMKLDGSNKTLLSDDKVGGWAVISEDWIYYTNITETVQPGITKIKVDGTGKQQIYYGTDVELIVNADKNWVYYTSFSDGINKITANVGSEGAKTELIKNFREK